VPHNSVADGHDRLRLDGALKELVTERHLSAHVIGNTLGALSALVGESPNSARTMASKLARFWRFVRDGQRMRDLRYELDGIRIGLEILEIRMAGRLVWRIEGGQGTNSKQVPALAVQAMVDLAISEGVESSTGPCTLIVRSGVSDRALYVEVEDSCIDWTGTPPESLVSLRRVLAKMYPASDLRESISVSAKRQDGRNIIRLHMPENAML